MLTRRRFLAASPAALALPGAFAALFARQCGGGVSDALADAEDFAAALRDGLAGSQRDAAERWLIRVQGFRAAFDSATDAEGHAALLPLLSELVGAFQSDIRAMFGLNPVAVAGIDGALRILARRFQREAGKVKASSPGAATRGPAGADTHLKVLAGYLATDELKAKK